MPIAFKQASNTITIRADSCTGQSENKDLPCLRCEGMQHTPNFREFVQQAIDAAEFTNWQYLNSNQLQSLLKKLSNKCHELRNKARIPCPDSYSFSDLDFSYQTLGGVSPL